MAETMINEVGSAPEVGNDSAAGNYFDDFQLVDDDGSSIVEKTLDKGSKGQNQEPISKALEQKEPETKKPDAKAEAVKAEATKPVGFAEKFFKADENGNSVFDAEGALAFFNPQDGKSTAFSYQPKQSDKPAEQPGGQQQPAQPENPYLKRVKEEREFETNARSGVMTWPNKYQEAISKGYQPEQAVAYANQACQEILEQQVSTWKMKRDEEEADRRYKDERTREEYNSLKAKSEANEHALKTELGGEEQYRKFLMGYQGPDGKFVKGYGTDAIFKLYDLQNPDKPNPSQEDMNKWWYRFASDQGNLQFLREIAMARLQREILPQLIQHGAKVKAETEKQRKIAGTRAPSSINAVPKKNAGLEDGSLAGFFQSPNQRTINTV